MEKLPIYTCTVAMEKDKLTEVLEKIDQAKEMLRECYFELEKMGVLIMKKDAVSGN